MTIESSFCHEQTLTAAIERLRAMGYTASLTPLEGGRLRVQDTGATVASEGAAVEAIERFEGVSDPQDEACLLGLRVPGPCGPTRGLLVLGYGPSAAPAEGELLARLVTATSPRVRARRGRRVEDRARRATSTGSAPP